MKKIFVILFVLIFTVTSVNAKKRNIENLKFPRLNKIVKPDIKKAVTDNKIKLRLIKDERFPVITMRVYVKGGDVYDPADKTGLASVTSNLLRIGGAGKYSSEKIDEILESKGITISIFSNNDYFTLSISSLKENFDEAVKILSLMIRQPLYNKEKFEEVNTRLYSSISRRNDDPSGITTREFMKLIFGKKSPVSSQLEYETLDNISIKDVKEEVNRFFTPANMSFGATGPIGMNEFKKVVTKYFGDWKKQAGNIKYPKVDGVKTDFKVAFAQKDNLNQSYLNIGHLGYVENIDKKAAILVFNSIFSSGFNSRLMQRLRVKMGLTYGIGGGIIDNYLHKGRILFSTFTKSETTIEAIKAVYDEVRKIRTEKVTEKELRDAKDYFLNSYVFKFSSPEKILYNYMSKEFYGLDIKRYDNLVNDIKSVSADDVLNIAKDYLDPEKMIVMIVGNKKKIKGDLSTLGKVKQVDISIKPPALKEIIPAATKVTLEKGKKLIFKALDKNYAGYKSIRSLKTISDISIKMMGREINVVNESTTLYPDKVYSVTKVMGMEMKRIINGTRGFIMQMGQKRDITAENILKGRFATIYDIYHNSKKYNFQFLKKEKIGQSVYDVIYLFDAKKNWKKFFINSKTGLIEYKEGIENINGKKGLGRTVNSKFKKIGNIQFAFDSKIMKKGKKVVGIVIKDIKINPVVDKKIFTLK